MRIALGADHAGFEMKEQLRAWLVVRGHEVEDLGTHGPSSVDYPDFAGEVGRRVNRGEADLGVLVCGSGTGMAISANKVRGVRAANCWDVTAARLARAHNDANVLALGSRLVGPGLAEDILETFLETPFEQGRHSRRIDKITDLDAANAR